MPQTPYFVRNVDLSAAIALGSALSKVAPKGMPVKDVGVLALPAAAVGTVFLHLGQKGDPIPLNLIGQNFHLEQPEDTGIWVSCPVSPGAVILTLLVGLSSTTAHS